MNNFVALENSFFGPDFLDSLMEQFGALCSISRLWRLSPSLLRSRSNLLLGGIPAGLTTLQHKYPPLPQHFSSLHLTFSLPVSFLSLWFLFHFFSIHAPVLFTSFSFGRLEPHIHFPGVKTPFCRFWAWTSLHTRYPCSHFPLATFLFSLNYSWSWINAIPPEPRFIKRTLLAFSHQKHWTKHKFLNNAHNLQPRLFH